MQSIKSRLFYYVIRRKIAQFRKLGLSLVESRELRDRESIRAYKMPKGILSEEVLIQGIRGEWLRPVAARHGGILLYLHGGAYVTCSIKTHRALAANLALAAETVTFIIDYRLAPEHPFPAAVDDAYAVYTAIQLAHPKTPIAVAGDSAGGGLTMALAMRIRDEELHAPAALALLSPWTDLTLGNLTHNAKASVDPFFPDTNVLSEAANAYAGGRDLKTPLISPLFADLSRLPPTLIHVGEREVLLDDSRILAHRMTAQGSSAELKVYSGMWHVWQAFAGQFCEADQSVSEIGEFLRTHLAQATKAGVRADQWLA